jgi:hypothetical protein
MAISMKRALYFPYNVVNSWRDMIEFWDISAANIQQKEEIKKGAATLKCGAF